MEGVLYANVPQEIGFEVELEDIAFDVNVDILSLCVTRGGNVRKETFMGVAWTMRADPYVVHLCYLNVRSLDGDGDMVAVLGDRELGGDHSDSRER